MEAKDIPGKYCYNQNGFYQICNPDGRQYFKELREAIVNEYDVQGYCEYIDNCIERKKVYFKSIEIAVIRELSLYYCNDKELTDVDSINYIPHNQKGFLSWKTWHEVMDVPLDNDTLYRLEMIRKAGKRKHMKLINDLIARGKSMMGEAGSDVAEVRAKAEAEAERIKAEARAVSEKIRQDAQNAARQMQEEARQRSIVILSEAEMKAKEILETAQNQCPPAWDEEAAKERIGKHFAQYQVEVRDHQEQWLKEASEKDAGLAEEADRIHRQMCDVTNAAQVAWGTKMNEAIEGLRHMEAELRTMESDFFDRLREWQTSLYPRDLERIARNYTELYRAVNIDKIIQVEAVFQISEGAEKPSLATVEALEKLEVKLRTYLKRFEQALKGLGLYVLFPQEGELFDDALHSCSSMPDETAVVVRCITPAIIHKLEGEGNENVVVRAEVEVRTTGKEAMSHEHYNV